MFGWGKNNFRFELSEVNNIHDDEIQDISDLVNFMGNENLDLQYRGETGSVVITKLKADKSGEQVIYSEKIDLPIDCDPEEFEKILSKFYSKKPLAFEPIAAAKKSYNFIPEPLSKQGSDGYATVPDLNFEDEEIIEEEAHASEVELQQEKFSLVEAEEDSISEKDKKIKEQEEEIVRLRAMASVTSEPCEEIKNKELSPDDKTSLKDDIEATKNTRRSSSEDVITQSTEQLDSLYGKGEVQKIFKDQQDVTLEAIELMNQAKRGMQPRDTIEYQVAVEYEAEKKRKLKEAEEQALIKQQSDISAAQRVFEEKQKEIVQKAEIELHKVKKTIDQDFEKRKMDEVNSRMDKQKAYIKNFVADLATQMNKYIESGKDINL